MIGENNDDSDGDGGTGDEMYTDDYVILMAGMMLLTLKWEDTVLEDSYPDSI